MDPDKVKPITCYCKILENFDSKNHLKVGKGYLGHELKYWTQENIWDFLCRISSTA